MAASGPSFRVRLEPAALELTLSPGDRLLDALDTQISVHGTSRANIRQVLGALPTACRAANCGLCLLRIESDPTQAAELFAPPNPEEQRLLTRLAAQPTTRLGCQLRASLPGPTPAADDALQLRATPPGITPLPDGPLIVLRLAR